MEHRVNRWKDTLGIIASVTCAIHCAATPILIAFLPALQLTEWMASPHFHQTAAVFCVAIVSISIWPAFRLYRDFRVLALSSAGLGLVIAAAFFLPHECCSHVVGVSTVPSNTVGTHFTKVQHGDHFHWVANVPNAISPVDGSPVDGSPVDGSPADGQSLNSAAAVELTSYASALSGFLTKLQPWMTPLGGLFLVLAHGLNLRRRVASCSRNCSCHGPTTTARNNRFEVVRLESAKVA